MARAGFATGARLAVLSHGGYGLLLAACVVLLAGAGGSAFAASAPSGGQSRCAEIAVSELLSTVGEKMTATAKQGSGWSSTCGHGWAWGPAMPVGKVVSGCRGAAAECTIQTTQVTGGPLGWCISNPSGGLTWGSCAPYVVIDKGQGVIEGYTKDEQDNPFAEVIMHASGKGGLVGGLSGGNGFYALPVTAGTYTVTPVGLDAGGKATFSPRSTAVTVKPGAIVHANFTVNQQNTVAIALSPAEVDASGFATVGITITDTSPRLSPSPGPRSSSTPRPRSVPTVWRAACSATARMHSSRRCG